MPAIRVPLPNPAPRGSPAALDSTPNPLSMATQDDAIYIKTSKGALEASGSTQHLRRATDALVLSRVDGRASIAAIARALALSAEETRRALGDLEMLGFARTLSAGPRAGPAPIALALAESASEPEMEQFFAPLIIGPSDANEADPRAPIADEADGGLALLRVNARARSQASATRRRSARLLRLGERDAQARQMRELWDGAHARALELREARSKATHERLAGLAQALESAIAHADSEREERLNHERAERAKAQAEEEALARQAADAERRAREAELARERAELEAKAAAEREALAEAAREEAARLASLERARLRRMGIIRRRWRNGIIAAAVTLPTLITASALGLASMSAQTCTEVGSAWLGKPAQVEKCSLTFSPWPTLSARNIQIADGSAKVGEIRASLDALPLLWGTRRVSTLTIQDAQITSDALVMLSQAKRMDLGGGARLAGSNISLFIGTIELPELELSGKVSPEGNFDIAKLSNRRMAIEAQFSRGAVSFTLNHREALPAPFDRFGPLDDLSAKGTLGADTLSFEELSVRHAAGFMRAKGKLVWRANQWRLEGDFSALGAEAGILAPWALAGGRASAEGKFSSQASGPLELGKALRASGSMSIRDAALNVDYAASLGIGQSVGGRSRFPELQAKFSLEPQRSALSFERATSGPLKVSSSFILGANDAVSGETQIETPTMPEAVNLVANGSAGKITLGRR